MNRGLTDVTLKDGARMEVRLASAPDAALSEAIIARLAHKGEPWVGHLRLAFAGELDNLASWFHLGLIDGEIVGNVSTFEAGGHAALAHVYTDPNHRRRGIATLLMRIALEESRQRGVAVHTLGTGYDSAAYHIYHQFGFRSVQAGSGSMWRIADDGFLDGYYAPRPCAWVEPRWTAWPAVSTLFCLPEGEWIRSLAHGNFGPHHCEAGFINDRMRPASHGIAARVLQTDGGAAVGYASLRPDGRWQGATMLLDVFTHPDFGEKIPALRESLAWPDGRKVQAFACADDGEKIAAIERLGLAEEARLRRQAATPEGMRDVVVMAGR